MTEPLIDMKAKSVYYEKSIDTLIDTEEGVISTNDQCNRVAPRLVIETILGKFGTRR